MAVVPPIFDQLFNRLLGRRRLPYADFTGTTSATPNAAGLVAHGLTDDKGNPVAPSRVTLVASAATPAGFPYEQVAARTTTQVDIRATGASVAYQGRAWA